MICNDFWLMDAPDSATAVFLREYPWQATLERCVIRGDTFVNSDGLRLCGALRQVLGRVF
jgi:hypothetical protein